MAPYLGAVHAVKDLAEVGSEGDEHFGAFAAHAHQSDGGFRVRLRFSLEDHVYGVGLCVPARGDVIAVSTAFAVVDAGEEVSGIERCVSWKGDVHYHRSFEHHGDEWVRLGASESRMRVGE